MWRLEGKGGGLEFVAASFFFVAAAGAFFSDVYCVVFNGFGVISALGKFLVYVLSLYQITAYLFDHEMLSAYGQPLEVGKPFERKAYFGLYLFLLGAAVLHSAMSAF
jgi:hypothetical protein